MVWEWSIVIFIFWIWGLLECENKILELFVLIRGFDGKCTGWGVGIVERGSFCLGVVGNLERFYGEGDVWVCFRGE